MAMTEAVPIAWEAQTKLVTSLDGSLNRVPLFQRFPRRAVVVCRRGPREPTALEAALSEASRELGRELGLPTFTLGSSELSSRRLRTCAACFARPSRAADRGPVGRARAAARSPAWASLVADRVPWVLASGSIGLGRWSARAAAAGKAGGRHGGSESRATASISSPSSSGPARKERGSAPAQDAEICAEHLPGQAERCASSEPGSRSALAGLPRGFGHGDFSAGNLLVRGRAARWSRRLAVGRAPAAFRSSTSCTCVRPRFERRTRKRLARSIVIRAASFLRQGRRSRAGSRVLPSSGARARAGRPCQTS